MVKQKLYRIPASSFDVSLLGSGAMCFVAWRWVAWQTILPSGFAFQKMKIVSITGMPEMKVTATKKCSDMCEMNIKCSGMCLKSRNMCEIRVRIIRCHDHT